RLGLAANSDSRNWTLVVTTISGPCSKQRLQKLDVGGDDNWSVPVLRRQPTSGSLLVRIKIAVMLDDLIAKYIAKDVGRLLDNAGVGNDIDDAPLAMAKRVVQCERHAGECLSSACRNGKGVRPAWAAGSAVA